MSREIFVRMENLKIFLVKNGLFLLILVVLLGGVGYLGVVALSPSYVTVTCPDCHGTGKIANASPDCVNGTIPCPNLDCLEPTRGEWEHMHVDGHPETQLWHRFSLPDGRWEAYSDAHIGHVIQLVKDHWTDMGLCPICHGTGRAPCPTSDICPTCHGKGTVQKKV